MEIPIRVALVDQDATFRRKLRAWLARMRDIELIGEAENEQQAQMALPLWQPAVLLVELSALGFSPAGAGLISRFPDSRVIVLHHQANSLDVLDALQQGAMGHLPKENLTPAEISKAIWSVARGEAYLSPPIAGQIVEQVERHLRAQQKANLANTTLSKHEPGGAT